MAKQSAGILVYRMKNNVPEVFLCHPGGPFHKNKDLGAWSIPKGEFEKDEKPLDAAKREFREEIGQEVNGNFIPLKTVKYKNGKMIYSWAIKGDVDENKVQSNTFPLEWPPKSGKYINVPEIDKAQWFDIETARQKIIPAQAPLLDDLLENGIW